MVIAESPSLRQRGTAASLIGPGRGGWLIYVNYLNWVAHSEAARVTRLSGNGAADMATSGGGALFDLCQHHRTNFAGSLIRSGGTRYLMVNESFATSDFPLSGERRSTGWSACNKGGMPELRNTADGNRCRERPVAQGCQREDHVTPVGQRSERLTHLGLGPRLAS